MEHYRSSKTKTSYIYRSSRYILQKSVWNTIKASSIALEVYDEMTNVLHNLSICYISINDICLFSKQYLRQSHTYLYQ